MRSWKTRATRWLVLGALAVVAVLFVSCDKDDSDDSQPSGPVSAPASTYSAEVARSWSDFCYRMVKAESIGPCPASRVYGYLGVAIYEGVVQGDEDLVSMGGQLIDLPMLPQASSSHEYHWPTVLNATVAGMMENLFSGSSQASRDSISAFKAYWNTIFEATVEHEVFHTSEDFGAAIAAELVTWSSTDGFANTRGAACTFQMPTGPQYWIPTPPGFAPPHEPCWGSLRTFVVGRTGAEMECDPPPPPTWSTDPTSEMYQAAYEVMTTQHEETAQDSAIAAFWADVPGVTGAPAGHWYAIAGDLCEQYDMNLAEAAECYARAAIAVHDAFIQCWKAKYQYCLIRPVSYVQAYIDPSWNPSWATPPFPEYTSGHSSGSGAVSRALEGMMGTSCEFDDDTHEDRGFGVWHYSTLQEAAEEAALSRLLGGIHYTFGNQGGLTSGRCVGDQVNALTFRANS
ncbi:MAG: vanadium-dependent haloperoxidase [bacterium]|nr:vanadium-dependent haloperoxidase [bacterium]